MQYTRQKVFEGELTQERMVDALTDILPRGAMGPIAVTSARPELTAYGDAQSVLSPRSSHPCPRRCHGNTATKARDACPTKRRTLAVEANSQPGRGKVRPPSLAHGIEP